MKTSTLNLMVLALFVVLAGMPFVVDAYNLDVLTTGIAYGMMAMGLAVLIGRAGLPSLGHAAFMGVGGYAAGILARDFGAHPLVGLAAAALLGALLAALLGVMSLRAHGVYFLMISLAVAELVHAAAMTTKAVGGDNGMTFPDSPAPLFGMLDLPRVVTMYWYCLLVVAVIYVILRVMMEAPIGQAIVGSKDNAERMRALGYSVRALRMNALVLSGIAVGMGGALIAQKDIFISPSALSPEVSILLLVMVLVGGSTSLIGPFIAGVALVLLRSYISLGIGEYWVLVLGCVFVLTVYLLPRGLSGVMYRRRLPRSGAVRTTPGLVDDTQEAYTHG